LLRDQSAVLSRYTLHATEGTARAILGTGLYTPMPIPRDETITGRVVVHPAGDVGGITELASIVAEDRADAVILLLDPADPWADSVENRALHRVCIERKTRLIGTYVSAVRWATLETSHLTTRNTSGWKPEGWIAGVANAVDDEVRHLPIGQRTLCLISHDGKKAQMLTFAAANLELLAWHHRILATGTTGWLMKLIFAPPEQLRELLQRLEHVRQQPINTLSRRLVSVAEDLLKTKPTHADLTELVERLRSEKAFAPIPNSAVDRRALVDKILPLPSGPSGGDVLIANEVLSHRCHTVLFFQDPATAQPHQDDIRLFERTCQLPSVYADCVSDELSAGRWVLGLKTEKRREERGSTVEPIQQRLRRLPGIREIIAIPSEGNDEDSALLGESLARACAGYFHRHIMALSVQGGEVLLNNGYRISVAWGWSCAAILRNILNMHESGLIDKPEKPLDFLTWSPLIGNITTEATNMEASIIAQRFAEFYGGHYEGFASPGFSTSEPLADGTIGRRDKSLIEALPKSDLVLVSAAPWDSDASLLRSKLVTPEKLPGWGRRGDARAIANISTIFIDEHGRDLAADHFTVGMDHSGLREVAGRGGVILVCGGKKRRKALLAAIRGELCSVIVTTQASAEWVALRLLATSNLND